MWLRNVYRASLAAIFLFALQATRSAEASAQATEQRPGDQPYKVEADAAAELEHIRSQAMKEQKHILVFVGGNWCVWCRRLDAFLHNDEDLEALLEDYKVIHINYSRQNKNEKVLSALNDPQQHGFPVMVILDEKGRYIRTQSTEVLESGNGYDKEKVSTFLKEWTYQYMNNPKK